MITKEQAPPFNTALNMRANFWIICLPEMRNLECALLWLLPCQVILNYFYNFKFLKIIFILEQSLPLDLSCHKEINENFKFQKKLPCQVCGKNFDRPSLLKRHLRTHTGKVRFINYSQLQKKKKM